MNFKRISIVIPTYNELKTLPEVLNRIDRVSLGTLEKEIVIVDDGSTDGTANFLRSLSGHPLRKIIKMDKNLGKGAALRRGFAEATGDIILIQDADLEYRPGDYPLIIQPFIDGDADVVYGSRFVTVFPRRVLYFSHYLANRFLTFLSNLATGLNLSDMEVGYKAFTREAMAVILPRLKSNRFGIEPELTARIAQWKLRIYEVGISYHGRTYGEGKKIRFLDGLAAVFHIIRYNLFSK